ncbi:helix-turn-helix domain-containing protein [Streptomyces thermolilacinus]|uniref:helix-turn-helix domain-containing protein n=1 Tax=Streptomyces thermolilacinus TaxID=285540 RepID=UPI0003F6B946|nr:helix-turn-helix transcriptional regulator [Streptomyces thermolilacinus]
MKISLSDEAQISSGGTGSDGAGRQRNRDGVSGAAQTELPQGLRIFGSVLQALRKEAGLTQEQSVILVQYSPGYIAAKIEQGKRFPPPDLPMRAGRPRRTGGEGPHGHGRESAPQAGAHLVVQQWAAIEEDALALYAYECRVSPGLLQPEPYMREVHRSHVPLMSDSQLETRVQARLWRQRLLSERGNTEFSFIIEQHVLERGLGGPEVTRNLIDHLISCARLRHVELLIMPRQRTAHGGLSGPLYLAETSSRERLGYTEAHDCSYLFADPAQVGAMHQRYGKMRAQTLDSEASMAVLEHMRGAP